jgi:hypothetical protein
MMDKVYHIYARGRCIYHSLNRDEFDAVWETLSRLVEIYTEVQPSDLDYEEVITNKSMVLEASY